MQLTSSLAVLVLLVVACGADDISHRFYFPSQNLLLDVPDAKVGSGHGRRVSSTFGDAAEGTSNSGGGSAATQGLVPAAPSVSPQRPSKIREPSRCSFAIVGCCRAGSMRVNDHCFEQFQCHGPFWGESPCSTQSAVASHNIVSKYYEAKEAEKRAQEAAASAAANPESAPAPAAPTPEPEESSPFDPIGPLPSREDAMRHG